MIVVEIVYFTVTVIIAVPSLVLALWQLRVIMHNINHPINRRVSVWVLVRHLSQVIYQDITTDIEEMKI